MVYDGDCGFCRRWIRRWQSLTGARVEYVPYQQVEDRFPHIPRDHFEQAVHLIEPDGNVTRGAHAVFRSLALGADRRWMLWLYRRVPGVAVLSERAYELVANHRVAASRVTHWLWGPELGPPTHFLTRWLLLRMLAIVYGIAFISLVVQIRGLIGSNGILPAAAYLDLRYEQFGDEAYWRFPTLAWLNRSDAFLEGMCWAGAAASLLVFFRVAPALLLFATWVLYLSLYTIGQVFLSFQWDLLLLETGLLAVLFAPWKLRPRLRSEPPPSNVALWLIRLLVFKLMFLSGVVKILHDNPADPTWRELTALTFHYQTQCIPNAIAWYAHQLPQWFHKFSVVTVFVIEIGAPFLIFFPRRPRLVAFVLLVFLQILIILTGNYNFFNLLSITLCVSLLDDAFVSRVLPQRLRPAVRHDRPRPRRPLLQRLLTVLLAPIIVTVSGIWIIEAFYPFSTLPPRVRQVLTTSMRFGSVNSYGLFRHMTTRRPEIIVEGSLDGRTWQAYAFRWKPGDVHRPPPQVAPHQPRLDWQMWFAALGTYQRNPWFVQFLKRLLEGSPEVLALLETNPFPDRPPRYVRAIVYDYRFTDFAARRDTGAWWSRRQPRLYLPPISLESFRRR